MLVGSRRASRALSGGSRARFQSVPAFVVQLRCGAVRGSGFVRASVTRVRPGRYALIDDGVINMRRGGQCGRALSRRSPRTSYRRACTHGSARLHRAAGEWRPRAGPEGEARGRPGWER